MCPQYISLQEIRFDNITIKSMQKQFIILFDNRPRQWERKRREELIDTQNILPNFEKKT